MTPSPSPTLRRNSATGLAEICLREWSNADVELTSSEVCDLLAMPKSLVSFQGLSGDVTRISTRSIVGRMRIGSVDLLVQPKTSVPTLFGLLAEVNELAHITPSLAGYAKTEDIIDLLIQIFLQQVEQLVRRGLKRTYIDVEEELATVRGRIDIRQTMAVQLRGRAKVQCRFEEYSADGVENRTVLAALWVIARCGALPSQRRRLAHQLTGDFEGVSNTNVLPVDPTTIVCDRLTKHYEPVLRLAHVILASMGIVSEFGVVEANGFLLNMNTLFERLVYRRLHDTLGAVGISVSSKQESAFDESSQASIEPDIVIQGQFGRRLVADTKYKLLDDAPSSADLYQMLTYCRVLNIRRGVLIVAGGTERTYSVRDGETTIDVCRVNLDGSLAEVFASVDHLASEIREHCK